MLNLTLTVNHAARFTPPFFFSLCSSPPRSLVPGYVHTVIQLVGWSIIQSVNKPANQQRSVSHLYGIPFNESHISQAKELYTLLVGLSVGRSVRQTDRQTVSNFFCRLTYSSVDRVVISRKWIEGTKLRPSCA